MQMRSLKDSFLNFCEENNFEKNTHQLEVLDIISNFLDPKIKFYNFF